jgi:hypothetical protein
VQIKRPHERRLATPEIVLDIGPYPFQQGIYVMTLTGSNPTEVLLSPEDQEEMTKFGITRTQVDNFHYGAYRYTNLRDALAQAKRAVEKA